MVSHLTRLEIRIYMLERWRINQTTTSKERKREREREKELTVVESAQIQ
jgi:hypothetical protein